MAYLSSLFLFLSSVAAYNSAATATDHFSPLPDEYPATHHYRPYKGIDNETDHTTDSLPRDEERVRYSDAQFQKLIQLPTDVLNSLKDDVISRMERSTIENLYWASTHESEDLARAAALCRIAAIADYQPALGAYANILFAGRGVPQQPKAALSWYLKSAVGGDENTITFLHRYLKENTLQTDFNITEDTEYAAIARIIEEAYEKLRSQWDSGE